MKLITNSNNINTLKLIISSNVSGVKIQVNTDHYLVDTLLNSSLIG